jgi:hypothetical protein
MSNDLVNIILEDREEVLGGGDNIKMGLREVEF